MYLSSLVLSYLQPLLALELVCNANACIAVYQLQYNRHTPMNCVLACINYIALASLHIQRVPALPVGSSHQPQRCCCSQFSQKSSQFYIFCFFFGGKIFLVQV